MAHLGQAPTALDMIPGARAGINYLMGQVSNFQRIPLRLNAAQIKVIAAKRAAETKQDWVVSTRAALLLQSIQGLQSQQQQVSARMADVMDELRRTGLAMTPVELGLSAVKVAADAMSIFRTVDSVESQAGSLVSQTGAQVPAGTDAPSTPWVRYAIYGGLLYIGLWALKKGGPRGGMRSW